MLRSMYSGIGGMKNFQTKLDVIGNNIANVNTYGFKKGRTVFKDLVSQQIADASAPAQQRGGTNPKQIGLGSQLAAIDTIHTTGSLQTTGRPLDLAIDGDGYFQVSTAQNNAFNGDPLYTRAGNFYLDKDGFLVNGDGLYVKGFAAYQTISNGTVTPGPAPDDITGTFAFPNNTPPTFTGTPNTVTFKPIQIPTDAKSMSIGQDGSITYIDYGGELRWAGQLVLAKFPNTGGLEKAGGNAYKSSPNSGDAVLNFAGNSGLGVVQSGSLEMSNVDLSEEFTEMIVAQRGFQANTRIITTSDEILQELVNLKR